ncbi:MAG TPA: hypothetical protein VFU46_07505 [Gemmatimonadales bacterium]|nr:hypothetical protein [Gemmatimonadales bacterium]
MAEELELKSVVPDPSAVRARLIAAGAVPGFRGLMEDRRYDRDGALTARDEVLRVRRFQLRVGRAAVLTLAGMEGDRPDWERA